MSNDVVIKVQNLSKLYRLGELHKQTGSFREKVTQSFNRIIRKGKLRASNPMPSSSDDTIWALKDVSFEVKRGEVLGIIGRNGAGKSTLLKILSRITKPTEGTAWINCRVGSLLEVGTGFHAELTGRENIYLNGAILGMKRAEIKRKFDEIVDFAEIEKFIDTPVKRYSSGMYVRLAFAVAAHLEPEILLVDEVLAVGDASFQKKCLGKMDDVAGKGKTVLFVSHNMAAILGLCSIAILLHDGQILCEGSASEVVNSYYQEFAAQKAASLSERQDRYGNQRLRILDFHLVDGKDGTKVSQAVTGEDLKIALLYESNNNRPLKIVHVSIGIYSTNNEKLLHLATNLNGKDFEILSPKGNLTCCIPRLPLQPGRYSFNFFITVGKQVSDCVREAGIFDVLPSDSRSSRIPPYDQVKNSGYFLAHHYWQAD